MGLVNAHRDSTCDEYVRAMVIVVLVLNPIYHAILILIRWVKLVSKKLLMESFFFNEHLLLVANDHGLDGNALGKLRDQNCLPLFLFFNHLSLMVCHEPARAGLFEDVVNGLESHVGHLAHNLELLLTQDLLHVRYILMLTVSLDLELLAFVILDSHFVFFLQDLGADGLELKL